MSLCVDETGLDTDRHMQSRDTIHVVRRL